MLLDLTPEILSRQNVERGRWLGPRTGSRELGSRVSLGPVGNISMTGPARLAGLEVHLRYIPSKTASRFRGRCSIS